MHQDKNFHSKVSFAGALIAMGIVFGDLGTSPLYALNAVFHGHKIDATVAMGAFSAIFWTLTFQTTFKYVFITMKADNHGEGGIFSLYALIRRYFRPWLVYPAMAGAAFLLADGIITPPISVASAVEGVQAVAPHINTVPIIIAILIGIFFFQQFGSEKIGKIFGPVMFLWFTFIGVVGVMSIGTNWGILKALNPYYAYKLLVEYPGGFWYLGAIFLCTTGAEALYSDMGHVGRKNIRVSWVYIKIMLILCYAGQTSWLMQHQGELIDMKSPFYSIIPDYLYYPTLVLATLATIIASQALISGSFTLINEAIRLGLWPRQYVAFPTNVKGQIYIPFINWFLMAGCLFMVLHFKTSTRMEAAYGLSVTLTMLMTTILVYHYMLSRKFAKPLVYLLTLIFLVIEVSFLTANIQKIREGGWITLVMGSVLFLVMFVWMRGRAIKNSVMQWVKLKDVADEIRRLSNDDAITEYATNLVYLTASPKPTELEQTIVRSIFKPGNMKRASLYWLLHIRVTDEPYSMKYKVHEIDKNDFYFVELELGFRVEPRLDIYFRQVVSDLIKSGEIDSFTDRRYFDRTAIDDCKFVITESYLSIENDMPYWKNLLMRLYYILKKITVKDTVNYGLDPANVVTEQYPVIIHGHKAQMLERVY